MNNNKKNQSLMIAALTSSFGIFVSKALGLIYYSPLSSFAGEANMAFYSIAYTYYDLLLKISSAGIPFAIMTDCPVVPEKYLSLNASLAHKAGLPAYEALKAITINPAKILKLDNRVGSIKVGKDADFIICTSSILDTQNEIKDVYVNGKKVA